MTEKVFRKPILYVDPLATDDSAGFELAVSYAKSNGLPLAIQSVVDDSAWSFAGHSNAAKELLKEASSAANEKLERLSRAARERGISVSTELLHGLPFVEIISKVKEENHDIVFKTMMGDSEKTKTEYRSVARRLLRKCPCAVMLVHPKLEGIQRVGLSIGPEEQSASNLHINSSILGAGFEWARVTGGSLQLLHAWRPYGMGIASTRLKGDDLQSYFKAEEIAASENIQTTLETLSVNVPEDSVHLLAGDPQEVIPSAMSDAQHDLLVIGSVARSGIRGLLLGNTAESVLENVRCSVLVVKPDGFESPVG